VPVEEIRAGSVADEPVFAAVAEELGAPEGVEPPRPAAVPRPPAEAIDLLGTAGAPVLKRLAPALGALLLLVLRRAPPATLSASWSSPAPASGFLPTIIRAARQ
jgi:hypothetical protein